MMVSNGCTKRKIMNISFGKILVSSFIVVNPCSYEDDQIFYICAKTEEEAIKKCIAEFKEELADTYNNGKYEYLVAYKIRDIFSYQNITEE